MGAGQISSLLAIWSAASFVAEIPTGALADVVGRRALIAVAEAARASAFAAWALWPGFAGFALGFAVWGVAGSLVSGALEALVYDSLAAHGQSRHFAAVLGRMRGAGLASQAGVAAAAWLLFAVGGYAPAMWASVAMSLLAAAMAARLPDRRSTDAARDRAPSDASCARAGSLGGVLRDGWRQVSRSRGARRAVIAVAALGGLDAAEEYFGLIIRGRGVPTGIVPFAEAAVCLFAAACGTAAAAGRGWSGYRIAAILGAGSVGIILAAGAPPGAAVGLIALYYGGGRLALVIYEARLQDELSESSRATATSMAALATELVCFAVYGAWALRETAGLAAVSLLAAGVVLWSAVAESRSAARDRRRRRGGRGRKIRAEANSK